mmetsp:Transcript_5764/g.26623  ORF Transcript_5764/g.26623 Transcript_5764/m.26623 type:complete len:226 (-) Transcript_5764:1188-1865(-)
MIKVHAARDASGDPFSPDAPRSVPVPGFDYVVGELRLALLQLGRREELPERALVPLRIDPAHLAVRRVIPRLHRHQSAPRAFSTGGRRRRPSQPHRASRRERLDLFVRDDGVRPAVHEHRGAPEQAAAARALVAEVPSNLSLGPRAVLVGQSQTPQLPLRARERHLSRVTLLTTRVAAPPVPGHGRKTSPRGVDVSEPLGDGGPREHRRRRLLERHRGSGARRLG